MKEIDGGRLSYRFNLHNGEVEEGVKNKLMKDEKWVCPTCGTAKITPWFVKELEPLLVGIYPETSKKIIKKVGEMLEIADKD